MFIFPQYSEVIGDFEKVAAELKQQLLDSEHQSLQQLRVRLWWCKGTCICSVFTECQPVKVFNHACFSTFQVQEIKFQQEKEDLRTSYEKQVVCSSPL